MNHIHLTVETLELSKWVRFEVIVLIGEVSNRDIDLFCGPIDPRDQFVHFPLETRFPNLLCALGVFKSNSEARQNGWNKDIPNGFTDFTIGRLNNRITILKFLTKDGDHLSVKEIDNGQS